MENEIYLSDVSERDRPWDVHRWQAELVADLYRASANNEGDTGSYTGYQSSEAVSSSVRYAERMEKCSRCLEFALKSDDLGEIKFKLQTAEFCRVRYCPTCQWRRSLMWRARFLEAVPKILEAYPKHSFIFLTLTVRNCELAELRETVQLMNKAWGRLSDLKEFPAKGFVRSLEVTRNSEADQAHPHFHALLMVPDSYFKKTYLSQKRWRELWQRSLRIDYDPWINVKKVRPDFKGTPAKFYDGDTQFISGGAETVGLHKALCETLKYSVKPGDLIGGSIVGPDFNLRADPRNEVNAAWLVELTKQMHNLRATTVGGVFRQFLKEEEPEDLIHPDGQADDEDLQEEDIRLFFGWRSRVKRYAQN